MVDLGRHDRGLIYPMMFADGQLHSSRGVLDVCLLLLASKRSMGSARVTRESNANLLVAMHSILVESCGSNQTLLDLQTKGFNRSCWSLR